MYLLYIDHILFPVVPGKIETETETTNKTVELIDGSFVSLLGGKGATRISFDLLLPMSVYPFAIYESGFCQGTYFMDELNRMAYENKPVWFDVYRSFNDDNKTYLTNMLVTVDRVTFTEDASNGTDIIARVELCEYKSFQTKLAAEKSTNKYVQRESTLDIPDTYTVKKGDSLWLISKKFFDDGSKYTYLAEINSIKKPYTIYEGQQIKLGG